jgi:hypothetical protein
MASNSRDRDETSSKDGKDNYDNPFVKFKQHVDAQVSIALQGLQSIIGLPSTISKSSVLTSWADLDEHLKKRDEQQEREKEAVRESESNNAATKSASPASKESRVESITMDDEGESEGLDLYMPITKHLFSHLYQTEVDDVEWDVCVSSLSGLITSVTNPWYLRRDQRGLSHIRMLQSMALNNLNTAAILGTGNVLASESSLLPYLLFSKYSPLHLTSRPPSSTALARLQSEEVEFPYKAAFEDLLRLRRGMPMMEDWQMKSQPNGKAFHSSTWGTNLGLFWDPQFSPPRYENSEKFKAMSRANLGMLCILSFRDSGLLDEIEAESFNLLGLTHPPNFGQSDMLKDDATMSTASHPAADYHISTELELFAGILRAMGMPLTGEEAGNFPTGNQTRVVADKTKMIWRDVMTQSRDTASSGTQTESLNNESDHMGVETAIGGIGRFVYEHMQKRDQRYGSSDSQHDEQSPQSESDSEQGWPLTSSRHDRQIPGSEEVAPDSPHNTVISTFRTTYNTVNKDGSKETRVVVEKHFSDGSKSVTKHSKTEQVPWWRGDGDEGHSNWNEEQEAAGEKKDLDERNKQAERDMLKKDMVKPGRAKGWFWE